jgi:hypothetical protein
VQHDGGGWRCLVACALAAILDRFFQAKLSPHRPARSDERGAPQVGQSGHLFPPRMHGRYEPRAGTAGLSSQTTSRITCLNLVAAGDDFVFQYLQVITWLIIIKPCYYETLTQHPYSVTRCFSQIANNLLPTLRPISPPHGGHSERDGGSTCHICGNTISRDLYADS